FHATAGQDWTAIAHLSFGVARADKRTWEALAESARWFALVGTGDAQRPRTDQRSLFLIRLLQLRLAIAGKGDDLVQTIVGCVNEELPADVSGLPVRMARHLFLSVVLLQTEVKLPTALLVSMGLEYIRLCDELSEVLSSITRADFKRDPVMTG